MGHVFACKDLPARAIEWDFFGWEYALCRFVGGDFDHWCAMNKDYVIDYKLTEEGGEFGELSPLRRESVLSERLNFASRSKRVVWGIPVNIR